MVNKLPFLPDEFHYAIAAVATRSAQLDNIIEFTISGLFSPHQRTAKFILHNLGQDRLVDLLQARLHDSFRGDSAAIEALIAQIKKARTDRNEVWLDRYYRENSPPSPDTRGLLSLQPDSASPSSPGLLGTHGPRDRPREPSQE